MIKTNDFRLTQKELKTAYYGIQNFRLKPWLSLALYVLCLLIFTLFMVVSVGINYLPGMLKFLIVAILLPCGSHFLAKELYFHIFFKKNRFTKAIVL